MSTYHVITILVSKVFGSHKYVTCFLLRGKPQRSAIGEAVNPINIDPTLISRNVYYVFHNLHMLWVCTYESTPLTAALVGKAFESYIDF